MVHSDRHFQLRTRVFLGGAFRVYFFGFRFDPHTKLARVTGMAITEAVLEVFSGLFW